MYPSRFFALLLALLGAYFCLSLTAQEEADEGGSNSNLPTEESEEGADLLRSQMEQLEALEPILLPEVEQLTPLTEVEAESQEAAEVATEVVLEALPLGEGEFEVGGQEARVGEVRIQATVDNRLDDRTLTMRLPAPRGAITDRNGEVFAHNRVAWKVGIQFPKLAEGEDELVYAQTVLDEVNELLGKKWELSERAVRRHYQNRYWLPILVGTPIGSKEKEKIEKAEIAGVMLRPMYERVYPLKRIACHNIGYVGRFRPMPTTPIQSGDPLYEEWKGRSGLELVFDEVLQGKPGRETYLFGSGGEIIHKEIEARAVPGHTLVTTIDKDWQRHAENVLRRNSRRGAAVVIDIYTGEVLVLASNPGFDLNEFVPFINNENWDKLNNAPNKPMINRAIGGELYPPASTFKVATCVAALDNGAISGSTYFSCPPSITLDRITFVNWHRGHEGSLNVVSSLVRSNNVFMYKAMRATGEDRFTEMCQRFGFGQKTGIPLPERTGLMPTDQWAEENNRKRFLGHNFNESIGQGDVLATPLQVARMMAVIANGGNLPTLRLIHQIQDAQGRVLQRPQAEAVSLNLDPNHLRLIHQGLVGVVHRGDGTGKKARVSGLRMAAKTGTGQWTGRREVAWFAGYVPANRPRYAFAFLYEGAKGEGVSGGRNAGQLARLFFQPLAREINGLAKDSKIPDQVAQVVRGTSSSSSSSGSSSSSRSSSSSSSSRSSSSRSSSSSSSSQPATPRPAPVVEPVPAQPPARQERRGLGGLIRGIFD